MTQDDSNDKSENGPQESRGCDDLWKLSFPEYVKQRKKIAENLNCPPNLLDQEWKKQCREHGKASRATKQSDLAQSIDPWPEAVRGDDLLREIANVIKQFIVMPPGAAEATALWIVGAHAVECFGIFPFLMITSPTPSCGKTNTLKVIGAMTPKPVKAANISPSTVYRVIDLYHPTLLIDEADTYLRNNDALRGILNAGHSKNSYIWRTIKDANDEMVPTKFSTWGPKVIAMIGKAPPTIMSRSIIVSLKRALPTDKIERVKEWKLDDLGVLAQKAARFVSITATR